MYSPHVYDVDAERTGMFDPAHAQDVSDMVHALAMEAQRLGTPLWIGEYGGQAGDPQHGAYMQTDYTRRGLGRRRHDGLGLRRR